MTHQGGGALICGGCRRVRDLSAEAYTTSGVLRTLAACCRKAGVLCRRGDSGMLYSASLLSARGAPRKQAGGQSTTAMKEGGSIDVPAKFQDALSRWLIHTFEKHLWDVQMPLLRPAILSVCLSLQEMS